MAFSTTASNRHCSACRQETDGADEFCESCARFTPPDPRRQIVFSGVGFVAVAIIAFLVARVFVEPVTAQLAVTLVAEVFAIFVMSLHTQLRDAAHATASANTLHETRKLSENIEEGFQSIQRDIYGIADRAKAVHDELQELRRQVEQTNAAEISEAARTLLAQLDETTQRLRSTTAGIEQAATDVDQAAVSLAEANQKQPSPWVDTIQALAHVADALLSDPKPNTPNILFSDSTSEEGD